MEKVVLVDRNNKKIGLEEKILAHKKGLLHRAFSILIFNSSRELLLQKRASTKYHTPDLWTNTCCSHPLDGENYEQATERKLFQEMGMQCVLEEHFNFIYKSKLSSSLIEHEHDTVFIGTSNLKPILNPDEASNFRYISLIDLKKEIDSCQSDFTPWFKIILDRIDINYYSKKEFYYYQYA